MREKKMQFVLKPSPDMERVGEHGFIRLPLVARDNLQATKKKIKVGPLELEVHQAYRSDVTALLRSAKLHKQSANCQVVGFVSERTYLVVQEEGKAWLTEEGAPLTLGCDPEFVLVDKNGHAVYAGYQVDYTERGVGSDGPCAEIRPVHSTEVPILVEN